MAVSMEQLDGFYQFAKERVGAGEFASWQELFELWVTDFTGPETELEVNRAIHEAICEADAGLGRTVEQFVADFCQRHGIRRT